MYSFVLHYYNQGWLATQKKKFFLVVASLALVVGMQDNEYIDAQVRDAGGLFKLLDPVPCGAVPVYLHLVLQFQPTSSSTPVPVYLVQYSVPGYLIQCFGSSLPHPIVKFQSTHPVLSSILPHPVLQLHPTS